MVSSSTKGNERGSICTGLISRDEICLAAYNSQQHLIEEGFAMWIYLIYSLLCVPHFWYLCCIYDVSEIASRNLFIKTLWWSCFHLQHNIQKHYSWEQNNYIRNLNYVKVSYSDKAIGQNHFQQHSICCSMPYRTSVI